jgi:hypothetical protein
MFYASNPAESKCPVNFLLHQRSLNILYPPRADEILLLCTDVASHKLSVESAKFQGPTVVLMEILRCYEELAGKMLPPFQRSIVPPYSG